MSSNLLSQRVARMAESETLKMSQMARELKAKGHEVINLSIGEPDFDTPDAIKQVAKDALDAGFTKYTPVPGIPELREAISKKFKEENNLEYKASQIVVSNGAKQTLANIFLSLLDLDDEVIVLAPYWVSYSEIIKLAEGKTVLLKAGIESDFKVSAEDIEKAITPKTKALLFSSPCNPTGSVYLESELKAIAQVISKHPGIIIVADEIYEYINFTGKHISIGSFPEVKDQTVTVNGFSKGYAMTGWRLGYMGGPQWLSDACNKVQGQITSGANSFSQKAATFALQTKLPETELMKTAFLKRRDLVLQLLQEIPGVKVNLPLGAFYIFPDISAYFGKKSDKMEINNATDFCDYILQEAYVAVVSGAAFGADDCFRISYAASEAELTEAVARM
ncbi:MAG: pyridoxal phosphate-dependent aminotransferase, partial [Saprospiraceae bacterium]|nr:pyridoxal phosphate-dependent aminotransferase [Saprospiraceae bacterium]